MHDTLAELKVESSGQVTIEQIEADIIKVTADSSVEVVVRSVAGKILEASVSSSARVDMSGAVDVQQVTVSRNGTFDGAKP